jgi:hypothetical protein
MMHGTAENRVLEQRTTEAVVPRWWENVAFRRIFPTSLVLLREYSMILPEYYIVDNEMKLHYYETRSHYKKSQEWSVR